MDKYNAKKARIERSYARNNDYNKKRERERRLTKP
jgi:hypothetical protein